MRFPLHFDTPFTRISVKITYCDFIFHIPTYSKQLFIMIYTFLRKLISNKHGIPKAKETIPFLYGNFIGIQYILSASQCGY